MSIRMEARQGLFHLTNGRVSYMIRLAGGLYPLHLYWGKALRQVSDAPETRLVPDWE